jgi:hemerythrin-like domain-containing protein
MSEPLHTLKHEHRVIEQAIRALNGICIRIELGEQVPLAALNQIVDFIRVFADGFHHQKEETRLFPALGRQGIPHRGGPLEIMENEHEVERAHTAEMELSLEGFQYSDSESRIRFVEAARNYSAHLISHIQKEDSILFRLADEILSDEDKKSLAEGFREDAALLGPGAVGRYEQIASSLEDKWGV